MENYYFADEEDEIQPDNEEGNHGFPENPNHWVEGWVNPFVINNPFVDDWGGVWGQGWNFSPATTISAASTAPAPSVDEEVQGGAFYNPFAADDEEEDLFNPFGMDGDGLGDLIDGIGDIAINGGIGELEIGAIQGFNAAGFEEELGIGNGGDVIAENAGLGQIAINGGEELIGELIAENAGLGQIAINGGEELIAPGVVLDPDGGIKEEEEEEEEEVSQTGQTTGPHRRRTRTSLADLLEASVDAAHGEGVSELEGLADLFRPNVDDAAHGGGVSEEAEDEPAEEREGSQLGLIRRKPKRRFLPCCSCGIFNDKKASKEEISTLLQL